jgi:hypothetical protein
MRDIYGEFAQGLGLFPAVDSLLLSSGFRLFPREKLGSVASFFARGAGRGEPSLAGKSKTLHKTLPRLRRAGTFLA